MKTTISCVALVLFLSTPPAASGGAIHGTVRTTDGRELTGPIRWDRNENFWDDTLDAFKLPPVEVEEEEEKKERGFKLSLFGWSLADFDGPRRIVGNRFSIPFGHVRRIERTGRETARITLRNGQELDVQAWTTDLGPEMRELIIEDGEAGRVDLDWDSLDRVDFKPGPDAARDARRLYGTLEIGDARYTGFIVWDRDESLSEDVLDGDDGDEEHEIPFGRIVRIERKGRTRSLVSLANGDSVTLGGTNDVADGHRGVAVLIPEVGLVQADWSEVERVQFKTPPASATYEQFDGGKKLHGAVKLLGSRTYKGEIVWDRDEAHSWESLDGSSAGVDYEIPFSHIVSVVPRDPHSSEVRLKNGLVLILADSNDVDHDNKGLIVTAEDGTVAELHWKDVERVSFD